jgi:hypothetical protein
MASKTGRELLVAGCQQTHLRWIDPSERRNPGFEILNPDFGKFVDSLAALVCYQPTTISY